MPCGTLLIIVYIDGAAASFACSTYGGARDAMRLGDLAQALAPSTLLENSNAIDLEWPPADMPAFQPCAAHSCPRPFDDEIPFEFCDGVDDDHDGLAEWAACIKILAEADELDVEMVELVEHFEEVAHGSGDPVRGPDQGAPGSGRGAHPGADHRDQVYELSSRRSDRCTRQRSENPAAGPSQRRRRRDTAYVLVDGKENLGYFYGLNHSAPLIVNEKPHVKSWDGPQYSIHNLGIEESYGFGVLNEGQAIAVAKNVKVRQNEKSTARGVDHLDRNPTTSLRASFWAPRWRFVRRQQRHLRPHDCRLRQLITQ